MVSPSEIVHFLFHPAEQQGEDAAEHKIIDGREEQGPHLAGDALGALQESGARPDDLLQGDDSGQGGILHQGDDLIAHGGHNALDDLEQNHPEEDLAAGHAQHLPRLPLAHGDALQAAPVDFRKIAGVVDDEGHRRGGKPPALPLGPEGDMEHQAGEIVDNQQLNHQRGAPDDPDNQIGQHTQRLKPGHGAEHDDKPQGDGPQQGHSKQPEGLQKAHIQGLKDNGKLLEECFHGASSFFSLS